MIWNEINNEKQTKEKKVWKEKNRKKNKTKSAIKVDYSFEKYAVQLTYITWGAQRNHTIFLWSNTLKKKCPLFIEPNLKREKKKSSFVFGSETNLNEISNNILQVLHVRALHFYCMALINLFDFRNGSFMFCDFSFDRAKQYWLWMNQNIHSNIDLDLCVRARKRWRMSEIVNEHRRINRFWYSTWSHVDCSPICSFSYWRETACEYRGLMLNRKFWHANPIGHSALIDKLANVTFVFRLFMIRSLDGLVVSFILYIFDITSLINEYSTWFLSDISWNITRSIKYLWKHKENV